MSDLAELLTASRQELLLGGQPHHYFSLRHAGAALGYGSEAVEAMPYGIRILAENRLRKGNHESETTLDHLHKLFSWSATAQNPAGALVWFPARVLLQDFTGVPVIADLAALREAVAELGGDPAKVAPVIPTDLVVDHSLIVEQTLGSHAAARNQEIEYRRNSERYRFLKWGQGSFQGLRVVPPGTGIVHQINLETLAQVIRCDADGVLFPDTAVGADSHTTMVNALGVLAWGCGGIEAEAAMLGQGLSLALPTTVGVKFSGRLAKGATATDLVLTVTEQLRNHGVVGKLVEFYGAGCKTLSLADRALISNMAPEYGALGGLFAIDQETLRYLKMTGREDALIERVSVYAEAQGLTAEATSNALHSESVEVDLATIEPSLAGPRRPQDRVALPQLGESLAKALSQEGDKPAPTKTIDNPHNLSDGALVIAAITSCTNTSNPRGLMAAGLVAQKAQARGLTAKPWVKASLAPGSRTVPEYLEAAGLLQSLGAVGFNLVGYGCTTCIGNSGPLDPTVANAIEGLGLRVAAVLSGNRNFEGRIHPLVRFNYLASPLLVVALSLAGRLDLNPKTDPLATDAHGKPVFLDELLPSQEEVETLVEQFVVADIFRRNQETLLTGDTAWQELDSPASSFYDWQSDSTYVRRPPFVEALTAEPPPPPAIKDARILALLGDSVTTDHISPAGSIRAESLAGTWLDDNGVAASDFNAFGARRGNHEVMVRGTFASPRIRNQIFSDGREGGVTRHFPSGEEVSIHSAAARYEAEGVPLVVIGGREYGTGSSRDWAAKGPQLLGVRAVLVESFERIHRSNLVGMGILPLEFANGANAKSLGLTGEEQITLEGADKISAPRETLTVSFMDSAGQVKTCQATLCIDTADELETWRQGGILPRVARTFAHP